MSKIILTADRSIMNNFDRKGDFTAIWYGCADSFPSLLFKILAGEPQQNKKGEVLFAPYPLRKVEASIKNAGFNVAVISPKNLAYHLRDAQILGIHTVNPLGLASDPIFRQIIRTDDPYAKTYFLRLLQHPAVRQAQKRGLKILVGGAGAWQLQRNPTIIQKLGIDHVVVGETENIIAGIIQKVLNGTPLPPVIECEKSELPSVADIPSIYHASNSGCIEIGRGCVRGCKFCTVTKSSMRWSPHETIERELKVNAAAGITHGLLHAEDVLLYGQQGVIPDEQKFISLIKLVKKYYQKVHFTHFSLAAVSATPRIIPACMEILNEDQKFVLGEAGIETGSVRLLSQTMSGKIKPFEKNQWHEIIHQSLGILHDHQFIPYCSLILGLPGEIEDDMRQTLCLLEELKQYRCALLPINFTPIGQFSDKKGFSQTCDMFCDLHKQIISVCNRHNLYWVENMRNEVFQDIRFGRFFNILVKIRTLQFQRQAGRYNLFAG